MMFAYAALFALLGFASGAKISFPDGRIVGGEATTIEDVPYQISLQYYVSHICGGAILDAETIITAAHCVVDLPDDNLYINAGSTNNKEGGVRHSVKKSIPHQEYNPSTINNDIALLKLDIPLQFSDKIKPIAIADKESEIEEGTEVIVSGWGVTEHGGTVPEKILRKVQLETLSNAKCQEAYKGVIDITEQMICAGVQEGGKDSCQGDSGGPMVAGGSLLLGVVSFGVGCGDPQYPGVYANVTNLISWINNNKNL